MERSMADVLKELFDEMVAGEPPLRTTTESAAAAGRRLRARRRTLWTVAAAAAAAAVALVTAVPTLAATGRPTTPVGPPSLTAPTVTASPTASPSPDLDALIVRSHHCPSTAPRAQLSTSTSDGSILPDAERAAAAVLAAAPRIAPGKQFILRVHDYIASSEKWQDRPQVMLTFDVGDAKGYGFLSFQIYTEQGVPAADRAQWELDGHTTCIDVQRRDFPDGSVAVHDPEGSEATATDHEKVYYFSARGYDMN